MKLGLVLGGGGAKGSYQIGVLKALMEFEVHKKIECLAGTSIGAMNGVMLMSDLTNEEMRQLWNKIDNEKVYVDGYGRFKDDLKGIFSIKEVYKLLVENLSVENVHKSRIQGFATIVNIPDDSIIHQLDKHFMKLETIHLNKAPDPFKIALASASIPVIFGPTKIEDSYYIDGGMIEILPVQALIDQNCDLIITVSLYTTVDIKQFKDKVSIIDLTPEMPLGLDPSSSLNFSKKIMERNIELGYNNTIEIMTFLEENGYKDLETAEIKEPIFLDLRTVRKLKRQKKNINR